MDIIYARKLKKSVHNYLYQNVFVNYLKNINQFFYRVLNKLFYKQKKKLFSGGSIIVIAGLDATGKSTISNIVRLGWIVVAAVITAGIGTITMMK